LKNYEVMRRISDIQVFHAHIHKLLKRKTGQNFEVFFTTDDLDSDPFMKSMIIYLKSDSIYIKESIDISFLRESDKIDIHEHIINLIINTLKEKRPNLFI